MAGRIICVKRPISHFRLMEQIGARRQVADFALDRGQPFQLLVLLISACSRQPQRRQGLLVKISTAPSSSSSSSSQNPKHNDDGAGACPVERPQKCGHFVEINAKPRPTPARPREALGGEARCEGYSWRRSDRLSRLPKGSGILRGLKRWWRGAPLPAIGIAKTTCRRPSRWPRGRGAEARA